MKKVENNPSSFWDKRYTTHLDISLEAKMKKNKKIFIRKVCDREEYQGPYVN